jgi:hypothetical protein
MNATQIVAYTFRADTYAPAAILAALPTGDGELYNAAEVETALDELALAFGIDRADECTFDSADFPKVVFASQVDDWNEESLIDASGEHVTFAEYYA